MIVTAGIPDDEAVVADASRIVVVMRRDGRVEVDRSVKFLNDGVAVRLIMRLAFAVPYVGAVVRIKKGAWAVAASEPQCCGHCRVPRGGRSRLGDGTKP